MDIKEYMYFGLIFLLARSLCSKSAPAKGDNSSKAPKPKVEKTSIHLGNTWYRNYKLGENFSLPCTIYGMQDDMFILFVRLVDDTDYIISNGTIIASNLNKHSRYTVSFSKAEDNSTMATLKIYDMRSGDGGRLGCRIGPEKFGTTAYTGREITVYVPIHDMKMEYRKANGSYSRIPHGGTALMMNTYWRMHSGILCQVTVKGGAIIPKVELYLGSERVTKRFRVTQNQTWEKKGSLIERGYLVTYIYETFHPQTSDNDKWLECRAKVPMYSEKRLAVKLNVTYPPTFWCSTKAYGWPRNHNLLIGCNISMNPPHSHALWWWREGITEIQIGPDMRHGEYTTGFKKMLSHTNQFYLIISFVEDKHFHSYNLEIDNGMGLRQLQIKLIQGVDPDYGTSIHDNRNVIFIGVSMATGYVTHGYGYV